MKSNRSFETSEDYIQMSAFLGKAKPTTLDEAVKVFMKESDELRAIDWGCPVEDYFDGDENLVREYFQDNLEERMTDDYPEYEKRGDVLVETYNHIRHLNLRDRDDEILSLPRAEEGVME